MSKWCVHCVEVVFMPLTESKLKALHGKKRKSTTLIPDREGLVVSCGLGGRLSWVYRYRFEGKQERITFGTYPAQSLEDARNKCIEYARILEAGLNPRHATSEAAARTLKECADEWVRVHVPTLKPKTQALYLSNASKYFIDDYFTYDVQRARIDEWVTYFDKVAKESSRGNAGHILKTIKSMLRWCKARSFITDSKVFSIEVRAIGDKPKVGQRNLEMHEVGKLWVQINNTKATPAIKACSKLLLIFGARNSEVREADREEFDLERGIWTIPEHRSKTGKKIRRAIPDKAKAIIQDLDDTYGKGGFLIPGAHRDTCMTTHSLNRYIKRIYSTLHKKHKLERFVPHDFRRTLSTRLSEKEVLPHVTEKMLGHELGGIMAIYNKHDWIDEQAKAYQLWSEMISEAAQKELSSLAV